jgi:large subunit ribosomal protein L21
MYAVVKSGGKQYRVEEGSELVVEKLDAQVGDAVDFDVLFFSDGSKVVADPNAAATGNVTAEVVEQFKGEKVVVFKFKRRKGYKRTRGHRQELTRVKVTKIAEPTRAPKKAAKKAEKKVETEIEKKAAAEPVEPQVAEEPTRAQAEPQAAPAGAKPPKEKATKEPEAAVEETAPAPAEETEPERCIATTSSGNRCKNKAKEGSQYCGVHAKKYEG